MSRRCGSSKPTPTPLNGLAIKPGKTRRKAIEGNADNIMRQTIRKKPAAYRQCGGGGARRKKRYGKTNHRQNPPAYRQRGGMTRRRKANCRRTQALRQGKPTLNPSRRLPSWPGGRAPHVSHSIMTLGLMKLLFSTTSSGGRK